MGCCFKAPSYKETPPKNHELKQNPKTNTTMDHFVPENVKNSKKNQLQGPDQKYFTKKKQVNQTRIEKKPQNTQESRLGNQKQQRQQQQLIQRLKRDGVNHEDYVRWDGLFRGCPCCNKTFNQDEKPILRQCGHYVCNQNQCKNIPCFVPNCGKNSKPKIVGYWPYVQGSQYNFIIMSGEGNQQPFSNVNGALTFQQLISKTTLAKNILKASGTYGFMIGTKYELYENIRSCTISSKAKALGLQTSNQGIVKNRILITDKRLGGINGQQAIQIEISSQFLQI